MNLAKVFTRIALTLSLGFATIADAQEQRQHSIALMCDGEHTLSDGFKIGPIKDTGIIVNLASHTVSMAGFLLPITNLTQSQISFYKHDTFMIEGKRESLTLSGDIDRITGRVNVVHQFTKPDDQDVWHLQCHVSKAVF